MKIQRGEYAGYATRSLFGIFSGVTTFESVPLQCGVFRKHALMREKKDIMSHASLATRYRPQSFAEVTGQETVKAILSRAAAEDRVAPAYLLSGTRGVGKTTIARIFAKALNCEHAPVGEPCNECAQCRRITQGNHVDVVEIDGASNRGIEDARRLREAIAYAPMEGRYKVFIIDEAHMLTRESFNALLKTLEEPPPRATFILATTEAHKFPVTIVSRCQHFVFKAIPEAGLVAHLVRILNKEHLSFEESAVRLLARRAAGSVRDSMSLLGQTLALGGDSLTEAATRSVLGLAGQELYERLLTAFQAQDCLAVAGLTRELLERGVDLGFFLRELATLWRNLFLIRQAGEAASSALDMPEAELQRLMELAPQFEPAYIHAAWQMVLESQRQVLTSLEPSAALELLLLNLALLPRLVSLEVLSRSVPAGGQPKKSEPVPPRPPRSPASSEPPRPPASVVPVHKTPAIVPASSSKGSSRSSGDETPPWEEPAPASSGMPGQDKGGWAGGSEAYDTLSDDTPEPPLVMQPAPDIPAPPPDTLASSPDIPAPSPVIPAPPANAESAEPFGWKGFLHYCETAIVPGGALPLHAVQQVEGAFSEAGLVLATGSSFQYEQLVAPARLEALRQLASAYAGRAVPVEVLPPSRPRKTEAELKEEFASHPVIRSLTETFDAALLRCIPVETGRDSGTSST